MAPPRRGESRRLSVSPSVYYPGRWKMQISSGTLLVNLPVTSWPSGVVSSYTLYEVCAQMLGYLLQVSSTDVPFLYLDRNICIFVIGVRWRHLSVGRYVPAILVYYVPATNCKYNFGRYVPIIVPAIALTLRAAICTARACSADHQYSASCAIPLSHTSRNLR